MRPTDDPLPEAEIEAELVSDLFSAQLLVGGVCVLRVAPGTLVDDHLVLQMRDALRKLASPGCWVAVDVSGVTGATRDARRVGGELQGDGFIEGIAIVGASAFIRLGVWLFRLVNHPTVRMEVFSTLGLAVRWLREGAPDGGGQHPTTCRDLGADPSIEMLQRELDVQLELARRAKSLQELALETVGMGTWTWEPETGQIERDDRTMELMGRPPSERGLAIDESMKRVLEEDRASLQAELDRGLTSLRPVEATFRVNHPERGLRHLMMRGRVVPARPGIPNQMTGVVWDCTAQLAGEACAQRATDLEIANERLTRLNEELRRSATVDGLTGLLNRQAILDVLDAEIERSRRYGHPLSVAVMDLDELKPINDTYGHLVGDAALQGLASVLTSQARRSDGVGRYGGDEFLLVLPSTPLNKALSLGRRITEVLRTGELPDLPAGVRLRCSMGFTAYEEGMGPRDLVARADEAMYAHKRDTERSS